MEKQAYFKANYRKFIVVLSIPKTFVILQKKKKVKTSHGRHYFLKTLSPDSWPGTHPHQCSASLANPHPPPPELSMKLSSVWHPEKLPTPKTGTGGVCITTGMLGTSPKLLAGHTWPPDHMPCFVKGILCLGSCDMDGPVSLT